MTIDVPLTADELLLLRTRIGAENSELDAKLYRAQVALKERERAKWEKR